MIVQSGDMGQRGVEKMTLKDLRNMAAENAEGKIAIAAAHDEEVLKAAAEAKREGIADAILVGDIWKISRILESIGERPDEYEVIPAEDNAECARIAVQCIREGRANLLMKGLLDTASLMRAVIDKETGLRTGDLISHIMMYECAAYEKPIFLTDGGMNTFPDIEAKKNILKNAAQTLATLGYQKINAACVCGAEQVNPKIQSTLDAQMLSDMEQEWEPYHMTVYGPVGLDLAISRDACEHKGYHAKGAGEADILLVPNYEVGNGIGKSLSYFGHASNAGIVVGAKVPVILVSRSDSAQSKLNSIALGSVVTSMQRNRQEH